MFEREALVTVFNDHKDRYLLSNEAIAQLRVKDVEKTGVGAYVTFCDQEPATFDEARSDLLGYESGEIKVPNVPSGLGCVVDVTRGEIRYIELFTYGDETWDGNTEIEKFSFIQH